MCQSMFLKVRSLFVAGEERVLVTGDYSQLELRVLAHLSGDCEAERDPESETGRRIQEYRRFLARNSDSKCL